MLGVDHLSVDILLDPQMDLLSDAFYESLLRVCASGVVGSGAASPSCGEYSRLKLRPNGPKALRTPEFSAGLPELAPDELQRVQESFITLFRRIQCLRLIHLAGGHIHLEQPTNAMSWLEPEVQQFLKLSAPYCVNLAACSFDVDFAKSWMFATSFFPLTQLGSQCNHAPGAHRSIVGVRKADGPFLSRGIATYPVKLCQQFALLVSPLLSHEGNSLDLSSATRLIPTKGLHDLPVSHEDGGGLHSQPDWSRPSRSEPDCFHDLRAKWLQLLTEMKLPQRLPEYFSSKSTEPPFDEQILEPFANALTEFLTEAGQPVDWSVREHQPMNLCILQSLSQLMGDADIFLFPSLLEGVSTGFFHGIPPSNSLPKSAADTATPTPLSVHMRNWQSADTDIHLTQSLVQQELDHGWVYPFHGTVEEAQEFFSGNLAVGRLGVATSDSRPPRLVVDSSICGVNDRCVIEERATLPSAKDVMRCYPLRRCSQPLCGFSLDIKSAHKRIVVKESEQGLLGFTLQNQLYFYRVCPFGATFSAFWWQRLGGFLLRFLHRLVWWPHSGFLYVDDFLFILEERSSPLAVCIICILCQVLHIPVSWKKCELGRQLTWIGWSFHIFAGYIEIPSSKLERLTRHLHDVLKSSRTHKKPLEKLIGLLNWITQIFPLMRVWMVHLYRDLFAIPASHYSVDPGSWTSLQTTLNDELIFIERPPGTVIPVGSKLLAVRHQEISTKADLSHCHLTERRIWLRIRDPASNKRRIQPGTERILRMYLHWVQLSSPMKCLRPRPLWQGQAAADACANSDFCQIGGFIFMPSGRKIWFSERFVFADFDALNIPVSQDLQRDISSYECLAQIAILWTFSRTLPGFRYPLCLPSWTDNTGAEAGGNRLFSMSSPMCLFLEKLTLLCSITGMELDLSHIAGSRNDIADALSRWDFESQIPLDFSEADRLRITLGDLWTSGHSVSLYPPSTHLSWSLP